MPRLSSKVPLATAKINAGFIKLSKAAFDRSQEARPPRTPISGIGDRAGYVPVQTGRLQASGRFSVPFNSTFILETHLIYFAPYASKVEFGSDDNESTYDPNAVFQVRNSRSKTGFSEYTGGRRPMYIEEIGEYRTVPVVQNADGSFSRAGRGGQQGRLFVTRAVTQLFREALGKRYAFQQYVD
jgi:hypothetical protein